MGKSPEDFRITLAKTVIAVAKKPTWTRAHWGFDEAELQANAVRARAILDAAKEPTP